MPSFKIAFVTLEEENKLYQKLRKEKGYTNKCGNCYNINNAHTHCLKSGCPINPDQDFCDDFCLQKKYLNELWSEVHDKVPAMVKHRYEEATLWQKFWETW